MGKWKMVKLGDVLVVLRNGISVKQNKDGEGQKISRIESIATGKFDINRVGYANLTTTEQEKYRLQLGDILFSHINSPPHVGKTALFTHAEKVFHGMNLLLMRSGPKILPKYLDFYLKFLQNAGFWKTRCKQSVNQASVNQQDVKTVPIPLPPLDEQERIVAILDEAFAAIDTAVANTQKNLENAKELFEGYREGLFEAQDSWIQCQIGECFKVRSGDFLSKKMMNKNGPYVVYGGNGPAGMHDASNLEDENILIGRVGAKCGNVQYVNDSIWVTDNAFYVYDLQFDLNFQFLAALLDQSNLGATANQTAQPVISFKTIRSVEIAFPNNKEEQVEIMDDYESMRQLVTDVQTNWQQKLTLLAELKQSLLSRAFSGELTGAEVVEE